MRIEVGTLQEHIDLVQRMAAKGFTRPYRIDVDFSDGRTLDQNALLWSCLGEISKQVVWHDQHLSPEDWKHILTASLLKQRAVPGIDGGLVFLGLSTSKMSKATLSDLMEVIFHFGAENNVKFKTDRMDSDGWD